MDPLSVTASAIAILQLTTSLIKITHSYAKQVKNARKEIKKLIEELTNLSIVFENLQAISERTDQYVAQRAETAVTRHVPTAGPTYNQSEDSPLPTVQKMIEAGGPLQMCYNQMLAFQAELTKNQSKIKKSLTWPFQKEDIKEVLRHLRNLKSDLDTAINSDAL